MKLYAFGGACETSDAWGIAIVVFITHEVIS